MSQPATLIYLVTRKLVFVVTTAAMFASLHVAGFAESAANPTISRVEIGVKNHFKVGFWALVRVEVAGAAGAEKPRVEITVPDSDGVPTTSSAPLAISRGSNDLQVAVVYTKIGRVGSQIQVSLFDGAGQLDEQILRPVSKAKAGAAAVALPATSELIVSFSSVSFGLHEAFPDRQSDGGQLARQLIELNQVADLPTEWFGYEGIDVLVISDSDGKLSRMLSADTQRLDALTRWVELGGRLVLLCGGQASQDLLGPSGPLVRFAPGKLGEVIRLPDTGALEHFAGAAAQISISPEATLRVPRFDNVTGNVEAYAGERVGDFPIVVRSPHGLGEVAFAGVDFSRPPLADWSGRTAFLQALLRPYLANIGSSDSSQRLVTRGYNDLGGAMRQQLGQSFVSVVPIGFAVVAGLAIAYMVFLGPLDYLLVNRWLRRPWVAWISFPLIVLAFCGAAMSLASWRNGQAGPRANRLELVDVDTISGRARGTLWTTLYSPTAARFDVSVAGRGLNAESARSTDTLLSWWGLPGVGIGGMQSGGVDLGIVLNGYRYGPERKSLQDMPVLASATKSLMARWTAPAAHMVEAKLTDQNELAVGFITNQSGLTLQNVRLLYGSWAYRLGTLNPGQRMEVGEQLSPRRLKTIVTRDVLSDGSTAQSQHEGHIFVPEEASPRELLNLIMFYDAAGGFGFAHLQNRYQAYCDLSRLLELGRAILVADTTRPAAQLINDATGSPFGDNQDDSTTIYRFVLPVAGRNAH
jgi:hypothetical protein